MAKKLKVNALEQVFEERVARALATIGVPAPTEIAELRHRIDELERMVAALAGQQHASPAPLAAPSRRRAARAAPAEPEAGKRATRAGAKDERAR
jgi:hypothetical protein